MSLVLWNPLSWVACEGTRKESQPWGSHGQRRLPSRVGRRYSRGLAERRQRARRRPAECWYHHIPLDPQIRRRPMGSNFKLARVREPSKTKQPFFFRGVCHPLYSLAKGISFKGATNGHNHLVSFRRGGGGKCKSLVALPVLPKFRYSLLLDQMKHHSFWPVVPKIPCQARVSIKLHSCRSVGTGYPHCMSQALRRVGQAVTSATRRFVT